MKKAITISIFSILFTINSYSQITSRGTLFVDSYYGLSISNFTFDGDQIKRNNSTFVGPLGLKAEFMVTQKIGIGADYTYSKQSKDDVKLVYNATTSLIESNKIDNFYQSTKNTLMFTFNYHVLNNKIFEAAFNFGLGMRSNKLNFDPSSITSSVNTNSLLWSNSSFTSRIGFTVRAFITDHIGVNVSVGFGRGGLINGGLSFKL